MLSTLSPQKILNHFPKERHNVFLFGQTGMGKTSFSSTVRYCFGEAKSRLEQVKDESAVGIGESNTKHLRCHKLPNSEIYLFDTWGLFGENYTEEKFRLFLQGQVEPDHQEDEAISGTFRGDTAINVVIFFIPAEFCTPENARGDRDLETHWEKLRPFYQVAESLKLPVLFSLCKIDKVFGGRENIKIPPAELQKKKEYEEITHVFNQVVSRDCPVPRHFPLITYGASLETILERDAILEEYSLQIIRQTLEMHFDSEGPELENLPYYWDQKAIFKNESPVATTYYSPQRSSLGGTPRKKINLFNPTAQ